MQDLTVSLIQADLAWQAPDQNRHFFDKVFTDLDVTTDLIVLPEMFTSGFSMQPEVVAEPALGKTVQWMSHWSQKTNAAIVGSIATRLPRENGEFDFVNRLYFVNGEHIEYYDKKHLFRMGGEHQHYLPGEERLVIDYKGWSILPLICYDLRFPVFARNRNDYDLMICVANWPEPRRHPWRVLLQARAIENSCYTIGVNRIGTDGNGLDYSGDSLLVDYKGQTLIDGADSQFFVETRKLKADDLALFRKKFPCHLDADAFTLTT